MIGISLEDLGIEVDSAYEQPATQEDAGYPKAYDFTLDLHIHGSWRQMRDALYPIAEAAFRGRETPFLGFALHWAAQEDGDTEESIKAALTGLKYDQEFHKALEANLKGWAVNYIDPEAIRQAMSAAAGSSHEWFLLGLAKNEDTPQGVLQQLLQEPAARYGLLSNTSVGPQLVRDLYELTKDEPGAAALFVRAATELPSDVLEAMAKRDYEDEEIADRLVVRDGLTEQALLDLIGKCDVNDILYDHACTDRVRAEIDRVSPSGGALTPGWRMATGLALEGARAVIAGHLDESDANAGVPLLLKSLRKYPGISIGLAGRCLAGLQTVDDLATHRQDPWMVAELTALGLPAQGWDE